MRTTTTVRSTTTTRRATTATTYGLEGDLEEILEASLKAPTAAGGSRTTRDAIPPGGVAAIQGTVTPGSWRLQVGQGIDSARLKVGRERESADGELLLP